MVGFYNPDELPEQGGDLRGVMLLVTDPPKHTRYRKLVNKGFTPRMIGLLEQYLTHRTTLIVDEVIEKGSCDFVTDLAAELPLQAIAEIMGVPQEDRKLLFDWSNRMIGIDDPEYGGTDDNMTAMTELYSYVNQLAQLRKADPRDDIVTKLINSEIDGDRLSDAEFEFFMLLLTVAGNETTRNTTSWGMHALMQNPDQYQLLRREPGAARRGGRGDPALGVAGAALPPHRHGRHRDPRPGDRRRTTRSSCGTSRPTVTRTSSKTRSGSTSPAPPTSTSRSAAAARTSASALTWPGPSCGSCSPSCIERIPDMKMTGEPDILRSNFIGGVKHMPVAFTPGQAPDGVLVSWQPAP